MLRAGYIVSLLEKLPYDKEVEFQMKAGPEATFFSCEDEYGTEMNVFLSDEENIVVRENGASIILKTGF